MNFQVSDNVNYSGQTTTVPQSGYWGGQAPNTCPGCGRCRDCGRPYETQPAWPAKPLSEAAIRVLNSIINARVPEENFYRDSEE